MSPIETGKQALGLFYLPLIDLLDRESAMDFPILSRLPSAEAMLTVQMARQNALVIPQLKAEICAYFFEHASGIEPGPDSERQFLRLDEMRRSLKLSEPWRFAATREIRDAIDVFGMDRTERGPAAAGMYHVFGPPPDDVFRQLSMTVPIRKRAIKNAADAVIVKALAACYEAEPGDEGVLYTIRKSTRYYYKIWFRPTDGGFALEYRFFIMRDDTQLTDFVLERELRLGGLRWNKIFGVGLEGAMSLIVEIATFVSSVLDDWNRR